MLRDKIIESSIHVRDILRNISKSQQLNANVVFSADDIFKGTLFYIRKEKQMFMELEGMDDRFIPGFEIHISFLLKETLFSFDSKIISVTEDVLEITPPAVFNSSFKRHISRYSPTDSEELLVKMPDGSLHDIKNITTSGLAFYTEKLDYKIGDRIRNLHIMMKENYVCLDAMVRYILEADDGYFFYGIEFLNNDWFIHFNLFQYIFNKTYPDLHSMYTHTKEEIFMLFDKSGYFGLKDRSEVIESFKMMFDLFKKIDKYSQITLNPVFKHNNEVYMGASVLRIYNRTFLAQHLASIPESRMLPSSRTSIYLGINDYLICNPYYQYYLAYFYADNKWHARMYGSILQYIDDESKFYSDLVNMYNIDFAEMLPDDNSGLDAITMDDPSEFLNYAEDNIHPLVNRVYDHIEGNFSLSEIKQVYELIGLYLDRSVIKICKDSRPVAYAVCESYTSGLNLFNLLDSIRLYQVDKNVPLPDIIDSMLHEAVHLFSKYEKTRAYMFIAPDDNYPDGPNVPGSSFYKLLRRVMANKSGGIEYKNLLLNMAR